MDFLTKLQEFFGGGAEPVRKSKLVPVTIILLGVVSMAYLVVLLAAPQLLVR